jgi:hypothetical protein
MGVRLLRFTIVSLLVLLAGCGGGGRSSGPLPAPGSTSTYADQFNTLWSNFDLKYSYFDYKKIDWNAAKAAYAPQASAAKSQQELVDVLRAMLAQLHDQHVVLTDPSGNVTRTYTSPMFVNWDKTVWQQYMARGKWVQGQTNWGFATFGPIPYVAIGAWNPAQVSLSDLDAFLDHFRDSPGMIVDVRMNPGGDDSFALAFAGRFTPVTVTGGYIQTRNGPNHSDFTALTPKTTSARGGWQFTKPVILLVGRFCASSNETFISAMREMPNVTVVGDTTGGATANPQSYQLGGGWSYTVSTWIEYTAQRQGIEDRGIDPDIFVASSANDFQKGVDPVLDWAIQYLGGSIQPNAQQR